MERFDDYVERCLYDPTAGFYASGRGIAGRRSGDFITSPEVGPLFGAVLANALDAWWIELGQPNPFTVIDAGAGPATLLRAIQRAEPRCAEALTVLAVDPALGTELPNDLSGAVVLANELLDNLPFRIGVREPDGWAEVFVADREPVLQPATPEFATPGLDEVAPGDRVPVLEQANRYVQELLKRGAARVLVFDYGTLTTRELGERGGWLRTYRNHQRGDNPFLEPGQWDITTDIAVDQLPEPSEVTTQAAFLRHWGIEQLVNDGAAYWRANAATPDVQAMLMRSRVAESEALLDPDGLGNWLCLLWRTEPDQSD